MTQTSNRFFDEIARLMNDAAGVASGVRREFDTLVRTQADRVLRELDLVQREEFEAVKEMARMAREENEVLHSRLAMLEARLVPAEAPPVPPAPPAPPPAFEPRAEAAAAPPSTALAHDPPAVEPSTELPPSSLYGPGNPPTT